METRSFAHKALPKLLNLEHINFESCLVKTEGALKIAAALAAGRAPLKVCVLVQLIILFTFLPYLIMMSWLKATNCTCL